MRILNKKKKLGKTCMYIKFLYPNRKKSQNLFILQAQLLLLDLIISIFYKNTQLILIDNTYGTLLIDSMPFEKIKKKFKTIIRF